MRQTHFTIAKAACVLALLLPAIGFAEDKVSDTSTILDIGRDIEALKDKYPQLNAFSVTNNVDLTRLRITYHFKTHKPERRGGWTSGVPNPDANGIWFYIDIHDPDSSAEIHTQPVTMPMYLGDKKVTFLILEGAETKSVYGAIWKIMSDHGVTARQHGHQ